MATQELSLLSRGHRRDVQVRCQPCVSAYLCFINVSLRGCALHAGREEEEEEESGVGGILLAGSRKESD